MLRNLFMALCSLLLVACASLGEELDPPRVSIENFRSIPGEGSGPRFEVDLRIQNPNATALDIAGVSYDIALQGIELISGVSNQVPRIEGYTEEVVTLESGLNMIQMIRFFAQLGGGQQSLDALEYRVSAKIDFKGFMRTQRIEESGFIGESR